MSDEKTDQKAEDGEIDPMVEAADRVGAAFDLMDVAKKRALDLGIDNPLTFDKALEIVDESLEAGTPGTAEVWSEIISQGLAAGAKLLEKYKEVMIEVHGAGDSRSLTATPIVKFTPEQQALLKAAIKAKAGEL